MRLILPLIAGLLISSLLSAQNLAEKLGYNADAKLLIIHADDLGAAHSINAASIDGLEHGSISSASIMVPCPWTKEIAEYAQANAERHDLGLHLTVTCEWKNYKWGPVASRDKVPTLIDHHGFFHLDCQGFASDVNVDEVEIELRAQIKQAIALGIQPTHLDSHMGCLFWTQPEIFRVYVHLAREYKVPCLIDKNFSSFYPEAFQEIVTEDDILVDATYSPGPEDFARGMDRYYTEVINNLEPGFNMIIIHAGFDDTELQAITVDHPDWGSAWRQADYDFFRSEKCKQLIKEHGINLITWREVGKLMR